MQLRSVPDIVGDNTSHPISITPESARWVSIWAIGGNIRLGDLNVSATRGANITSAVLPLDSFSHSVYDLNLIWLYVPTGVTASITYGA